MAENQEVIQVCHQIDSPPLMVKNAWYRSAVLEALSTPSSPQFFIPSLESISGPVNYFLQLANQVTIGFSILFWEFNAEIPDAISAEKTRNKRPWTSLAK